MRKVLFKLIVQSPQKMRYETAGDYVKTSGEWEVITADMHNSDFNFLVLIHELIELYLTQRRGISEPKIKKFDEWFEREKMKGRFKNILSPGRHPKAPYKREHMFAVRIEGMLRQELGIARASQWKREDEVMKKIKKYLVKRSGR